MTDELPDGVLTPDELDLEPSDERIRRLGDDRYVVRTDDDPPTGATDDAAPETVAAGTPPLDDVEGAYAVALAARTDGDLETFRTASNDVRDPFEAMLRWYAERVAPDSPPEQVVSVLLDASDLDVRTDP
jgi:hypothetical protein